MPLASNASFSTARLGAAVLAATLASACKFPYPPDVPDDAVTDSDATTACAPSTIVCDDARGEYVACSAAGTPDVVLHCPLGCAPDEEKCLDIDPHNGLAMYLDMARTSPLVTAVAFSGTSEIDPVTGTASSGGNSVQIPSVMAGSLRVFMVRSLVVRGNLRSKLAFSAPSIAIVSAGDITIEGTFDVSADAHRAGAGFYNNRCPGGGSMMAATTTPTPGGGGGGGSTAGAQGGANSLGMAGFPGGARLSGPLVEPLERGCDGGYVEEEGSDQNTNIAYGGGGGGALQLVSGTRIQLSQQGTIDASGGGGVCLAYSNTNGVSTTGAGGGGGGTVVLEAPDVVLDGANVVISTKGGGGSAPAMCGPASINGQDGGIDVTAAAGGVSTYANYPVGGTGGTITAGPGAGRLGVGNNVDGAGGGGAVGHVAAFTRSGLFAPQNGAHLNSALAVDRVRVRATP